jgi:hypothetical protein
MTAKSETRDEPHQQPDVVMPIAHSPLFLPLRAVVAVLLWLVLVPQHLLPTLALLLWLSIKYCGRQCTAGFVGGYIVWVVATNELKHASRHIGPEWMCRAIRWCLHSCLDLLGCSR